MPDAKINPKGMGTIMKNIVIKELVDMWWQTEYYSDSQITKPFPLTDEDKKKGTLSKAMIATQFPKVLKIGLMVSFFHPMIGLDFEVPKVMWLLEYYNMNGTPPHNDNKRDLPRVKLFNGIEGVLNEVNEIIGSAEYQAAELMDAVIENLCTDSNFSEIDQMAALQNLYGFGNSSELKICILSWLLGIPVDDAIRQIQEFQEKGQNMAEVFQTEKKEERLAYVKAIDRLLKIL